MIQLTDVSKSYGTTRTVYALRHLNLHVKQGERVAVMGPSGSGKSTLLNLVCGLDRPTAGSVKVEGIELAELSDDARTLMRREKVGMIFQTFNLLPTLTALENVELPLRLQGLPKHQCAPRALHMLERVGLQDRADHRPDELSGGERQRVAIARALIFNPPVLLGDEPTGNLDSATGHDILDLLEDLHFEFNSTFLLVTHNAVAANYCDRILTLHDGEIVKGETPVPGRAGPR